MNIKKSYLKWAGGKNKMLPNLLPILEKYKKPIFVEPFVGAGNVCLNFNADAYVLNDLNKDLINSHLCVIDYPDYYIKECEKLFKEGYDKYYEYRDSFNGICKPLIEKVSLFQYLNKHGFNGLCRYNKKGLFNVPIGTIKKNGNNVPIKQIQDFHYKFYDEPVLLSHHPFDICMEKWSDEDALIYNDPPYVPMGASDIRYTADGFNFEDQIKLRDLALQSKATVVISNHWNSITKELYKDADETHVFDVQRTISCKGDKRIKVQECVVVYKGV